EGIGDRCSRFRHAAPPSGGRIKSPPISLCLIFASVLPSSCAASGHRHEPPPSRFSGPLAKRLDPLWRRLQILEFSQQFSAFRGFPCLCLVAPTFSKFDARRASSRQRSEQNRRLRPVCFPMNPAPQIGHGLVRLRSGSPACM